MAKPSKSPKTEPQKTDPSKTGPAKTDLDELSFEAALERLEALVAKLEGGELALETALASFEEGVRLTRRCAAQLSEAERRVEALSREGGDVVARAFDAPEDGG